MSMVDSKLAGRYRLVERIAVGGMGTVWRAEDEVLHRSVAVKVLNEALSEDLDAAARFEHEALAAASIQHPNMANVFDLVNEEGRPAIVMELVEGETLAARLARQGALPAVEAVRIACDVLFALEAAHDAGIIHRDVKPGNILLRSDGAVKLADLGIARTLDGPALTTTGIALGTAHYAAPEQIRGQAATPAADLYGVGAVFYEMLTGHRPFNGDSPMAAAMAALNDELTPPSAHRPDIPSSLEAIAMRALQRAPVDRFGSAAEMREALGAARPDPSTDTFPTIGPADPTIELPRAPKPEPKARRPVPPLLKRVALLWVLPLVLVALFVVAASFWWRAATTTEVPKFTGMSLTQARELAKDHELEITTTETHSATAKGTVIRQSIPPERTVADGATVKLTVSDGIPPCCKVPDLDGKTLAQAKATIENARLELGQVSYVDRSDGPEVVTLQNPDAGERVEPGEAVDITVVRVVRASDGGGDGDKKRGKGNGRDGG